MQCIWTPLFIFNFLETNCTFPPLVTTLNHSMTLFPASQQWHPIWLEKDSNLKYPDKIQACQNKMFFNERDCTGTAEEFIVGHRCSFSEFLRVYSKPAVPILRASAGVQGDICKGKFSKEGNDINDQKDSMSWRLVWGSTWDGPHEKEGLIWARERHNQNRFTRWRFILQSNFSLLELGVEGGELRSWTGNGAGVRSKATTSKPRKVKCGQGQQPWVWLGRDRTKSPCRTKKTKWDSLTSWDQ